MVCLVHSAYADHLCLDSSAADEFVPPELWDMHILRQIGTEESMGGAIFSDHQDRHAEEK